MAGLNGDGIGGRLRPMSVEHIVKKAQTFDYNPLIPLKYWLRTASTLLKEAEIYEHEGNDEQTYLLLFRHAQLVLQYLPDHPDARSPDGRRAVVLADKEVGKSLQKLEILKPRINKRYERFEELLKERIIRKAAESVKYQSFPLVPDGLPDVQKHRRAGSEPVLPGSVEALAAGDNKDLAVRLAHKEIRRRALARKASRQAGISEEVEHERRTAGLWGNWEEAYVQGDQNVDRDTLSRQMQKVRLQAESNRDGFRSGSPRPSNESPLSSYVYPTIPSKNGLKAWAPPKPPPLPPTPQSETLAMLKPPHLPPKDTYSRTADLPPRPKKELQTPSNPLPPPPTERSTPIDLKPSGFTFQPSAYLENGTPLRTIFLSPQLRHRFLSIVEPNTRANLETCGILCGTLISNALFISKLVIPEQKSTSDTCETINESALFDYVDGEDLMVLGWIHTHPTQTCFMSSRDLHTHSGYQVMMPESIAIVCAPSKGEWGVFRLTDPPGIKSVLNCTQTGLFHPHEESNLYTDALRPGHVFEAKGLEFDVVDLRSGLKAS